MEESVLLFGLLLILGSGSRLRAQQAGYSQTNLVSNTAGVATTTDPQLLNPWGNLHSHRARFRITDNNGGTSTLYDPQGSKNALVVTIPAATKNPNGNCSPGCPTGTVSNSTGGYFSGGTFIFDTEDGLIVNWTGGSTAVVGFDNSASGAVYKGLALLNGTFLLAANFNSGKIDVYDRNFTPRRSVVRSPIRTFPRASLLIMSASLGARSTSPMPCRMLPSTIRNPARARDRWIYST